MTEFRLFVLDLSLLCSFSSFLLWDGTSVFFRFISDNNSNNNTMIDPQSKPLKVVSSVSCVQDCGLCPDKMRSSVFNGGDGAVHDHGVKRVSERALVTGR